MCTRATLRALEQIEIAAHHERRAPGLGELARERGEHVVGFEPGGGERGEAQRVEEVVEASQLAAERRRCGRSARLVAAEGGVTKRARHLRAIERHRGAFGSLFAQQLEEQRREAVERRGGLAARCHHRREREEGPISQGKNVD
jgi:hypothetical protein